MADDIALTASLAGPPEHSSNLDVLVLGALAVHVGERTLHVAGSQRRRLLALLASRAGRAAAVETIVDAMWGDNPPPSAAKTVQSHVVRLRRSLAEYGDAVIETVPGGYRLALDEQATDAGRVERLTAEGRQRLRAGDCVAAAERFTTALALWRGPAYVEFRDAEFAAADGVRLDELHLATREDLAEAQVASRAAASAIPALERLVSEAPGRERAWGLLIRALYAVGRQHDALGAFDRARHALADSYGLEPGPELRALERQILDQDPALSPTTGRTALAAALRSSTPFVGRNFERSALDTAWSMARRGTGQLRILCGPVDSGRTRLAADLAGRALDDGGDIEYVRATDGFEPLAGAPHGQPVATGVIVDAIAERCRHAPVVLIVDDVEWAAAPTVSTIIALADALQDLRLLLVLVLDRADGGPAVAAIARLDHSRAHTLDVGPMSDADLAAIVTCDGVDDKAAPAVLAMARGLPGVARRESAAWAEHTASSRLRDAAASSAGALAVAERAQVSVLDEVLELVAARARRSELRSTKWTGRQPYRALASYEPQDAELFVGRERLVAELATRVLERRVAVVLGPSGSGKSSLVRAGLVPLAHSGRLPGDAPWRVHIVVPGDDPFAALDAIDELDEPGPQLLVVDQFEEAFSSAAATVDAFADRLLDLTGDPALGVHVVVVVRADQYGALAAVSGLSEAAGSAQLFVGPPTDDELRRIVEEPARRTGLSVEPALADLVAADVGSYDAALPLVSAAMAEVWERRDGGVLRADRYVEIGGLSSAVERLGEQVLQRAGESGADVARQLLLRLADITDEGQWTRRRVSIKDIPQHLVATVDALVDARLVVRSEWTIEIVHEVVFRSWPRLASWLDEARSDLVRQRQLAVAARTWDAEGRSDDNVYRGGRLDAGIEWLARQAGDRPPQVVAFLEAGQRRADREADEVRLRLTRQIRARHRLTVALIAATVLLALALIAGVLAVRQADRADTAATAAQAAAVLADAAALSADAERLGALSGLESELDTSLLLAAQAYVMADTASTEGALLRAVQHSPEAVGMMHGDGRPLLALALSPDGTTLAVNESLGGTTLYEAGSGQRIGQYASAEARHALTWTADGTAFATVAWGADSDRKDPARFTFDVVVVDAATMTERARYTGRRDPASDLAFSPDGRLLVAAPNRLTGRTPELTVWAVANPGPPIRTIEMPDALERDDNSVSFDASGNHVAVSVSDDHAPTPASDATVLVDINTGQRSETIPGPGGLFSPDGRTLAVNSGDGVDAVTLDLVDIETGQRRTLQGAHAGDIRHRQFNHDGTMLATGGDDRIVRIWDTATGRELYTLTGHTGRVLGAAFSADDRTIYSTGLDRTIITWNLAGDGTIQRLISPRSDQPKSQWFSLTDDRSAAVAIVAESDDLATVDLATGEEMMPIDTAHIAATAVVSTGGTNIITAGIDRALRRWDVATGALLAERTFDTDAYPLAVTADHSTVYVLTGTSTVRPLDAATLTPLDHEPVDVGALIGEAAVSPDAGSLAVSTYDPATVWIVDLETGGTHSLTVPGDVGALTFSPDGSMVIAGDVDGHVLRIDAATATLLGEAVVGHDGRIRSLSFAPDGSRFTSAGFDGNIAIWETATGRAIGTLQPGQANARVRASWAPDGYTLWVMYSDRSVYTFDTRVSSWFDYACRTASRQLSETEWTELLPNRPYQPACGD